MDTFSSFAAHFDLSFVFVIAPLGPLFPRAGVGAIMDTSELLEMNSLRTPGQFSNILMVSKRAIRHLRPQEISSADFHFHNRRFESSPAERDMVDSVPSALSFCEVIEARYRTLKGRPFLLRAIKERNEVHILLCNE